MAHARVLCRSVLAALRLSTPKIPEDESADDRRAYREGEVRKSIDLSDVRVGR